jgi:hypothetical protein
MMDVGEYDSLEFEHTPIHEMGFEPLISVLNLSSNIAEMKSMTIFFQINSWISPKRNGFIQTTNKNQETHLYAVFSSLPSLHPYSAHIFSALPSQTLSVPLLMSESEFHNHTEPYAKL